MLAGIAFGCLAAHSAPSIPVSLYSGGNLYVEGFAGQSIVGWLGSEDPRKAWGLGVGVFMPGPHRFRYRGFVPELLVQGYYHRTTTPGASGVPANGTDAYGVLALLRYSKVLTSDVSLYFDWGLGLQYADMRTVDLSGRLSSTPTLGIGLSFDTASLKWMAGIRYLHISNAGLQGNNQGQNQMLLTLGLRF